ncbi:MAG: DUF3576 domain-containing protein [Pseudomonadota bacterium]
MVYHRHIAALTALACLLTLAACGGGGLFHRKAPTVDAEGHVLNANEAERAAIAKFEGTDQPGTKIWDLLNKNADPSITVKVNKYIWMAALDVLNFLPVQSVDPFTGVIVTGYGTPPGGSRSYRATVYVQDPALDARSLKLSLQGANGAAVAPETVSAVEDAILNRARQLRIADAGL